VAESLDHESNHLQYFPDIDALSQLLRYVFPRELLRQAEPSTSWFVTRWIHSKRGTTYSAFPQHGAGTGAMRIRSHGWVAMWARDSSVVLAFQFSALAARQHRAELRLLRDHAAPCGGATRQATHR
jgi:hypothetical protein